MKLRTFILSMLLFGLMAFRVPAHAEGNCPPGYYPIGGQGVQGCAPYPNQGQQQQQPQNLPSVVWESRWGAIATDEPHGVVGSSSGLTGENLARKLAMVDCRSKGGVNCTLQIVFSNGCGALLVGDKTFNLDVGETEGIAIQKAMDVCKDGDTGCHVYFTTCSPAVRTQ